MVHISERLNIDNAEVEARAFVVKHFQEIFPAQSGEELETAFIKGGITNCLVKVNHKRDPNHSILVRIFGLKTEEIIDRNIQEEAEPYLGGHGVGKLVYATFENGQVESWVEGRTLTPLEMKLPFTSSRIANSVARLHNVPHADFLKHEGGSKLWFTLESWVARCQGYKDNHDDPRARLFDFEVLKENLQKLKARALAMDCPLVVSHMDILSGNVLESPDGAISFIDFEYTCVAEFAFDLANHFNECVGFNCEWEALPTEKEQFWFIRHYLAALPSNHPVRAWAGVAETASSHLDIDESSCQRVFEATQLYQLASHYFWGLWAIIQAYNSTVDFDYYVYGFQRLSALFNPKLRQAKLANF